MSGWGEGGGRCRLSQKEEWGGDNIPIFPSGNKQNSQLLKGRSPLYLPYDFDASSNNLGPGQRPAAGKGLRDSPQGGPLHPNNRPGEQKHYIRLLFDSSPFLPMFSE